MKILLTCDGRTGVRVLRSLLWFSMMATLLIAAACGNEAKSENIAQPASAVVTDQDIEAQLKFDARVQDFQTDGDKLIVNVNKQWVSSPPGMQMRATGQWFAMLRSARGGEAKPALEVVVQHDGEKIARWTAESGYEPIPVEKAEAN